ncbi:MAG: hypothetical protein M1829_003231 [Trizodia sp. TS-e1964]|nr:MAG: hypothetical protein M1829_003231 [Trizodia sp. TS-e1964]
MLRCSRKSLLGLFYQRLTSHENFVSIPVFLPLAFGNASALPTLLPRYVQARRGYASSAANGHTQPDPLDKPKILTISDRVFAPYMQPTATVLSDPLEWTEMLNKFLPAPLKNKDSEHSPQAAADPNFLVKIAFLIEKARELENIDLLNYIGVYEGRWHVVRWIIKSLINALPLLPHISLPLSPVAWITVSHNISLQELSSDSIMIDVQNAHGLSKAPDTHQIAQKLAEPDMQAAAICQRYLGQILQSVGSMVLSALQSPPQESQMAMFQVLQTIAYLHHMGHIPEDIYKAPRRDHDTVLNRSPHLYILSFKILNCLSDAMCGAEEDFTGNEKAFTKPMYSIYEIPRKRYLSNKVLELKQEIWLEFIVWCCLDKGYIMEAAWILAETMKQPEEWSTLEWNMWNLRDIQSRSSKANYLQYYTTETGSVKIRNRMLSSEVLIATIDGLVTLMAEEASEGRHSSRKMNLLIQLKKFHKQDQYSLNSKTWDQIFLRISEQNRLPLNQNPLVLEHLLATVTFIENELTTELNDRPPPVLFYCRQSSDVLAPSATVLGLFHRLIQVYTDKGNVIAALKSFSKLQTLTDANKQKTLEIFNTKLQDLERAGISDMSLVKDISMTELWALNPDLPMSTLASLIELTMETGLLEFCNWLLFTTDIDGPIIPRSQYTNPVLAPVLLKLAATTGNVELASAVVSNLKLPVSENILKALLVCQARLGKWDAVQKILNDLQADEFMYWSFAEAAAIAVQILRLEASLPRYGPHNRSESSSLTAARYTLVQLLSSNFGLPGPSKDPKTQLHENYRMIQLFKDASPSLESLFSGKTPRIVFSSSQLPAIPTSAFNSLISSVVALRGPEAGIVIVEKWRRKSSPAKTIFSSATGLSMDNLQEMTNAAKDLTPHERRLRESIDLAEPASEELGLIGLDGEEQADVVPNVSTVCIIVQQALAIRGPTAQWKNRRSALAEAARMERFIKRAASRIWSRPDLPPVYSTPVFSDQPRLSIENSKKTDLKRLLLTKVLIGDDLDYVFLWAMDMFEELGMTVPDMEIGFWVEKEEEEEAREVDLNKDDEFNKEMIHLRKLYFP